MHKAHELFCLCAFCQHFFFFFLTLFCSFIAFTDFCSASSISDCCWRSLQRAAFTWWKGNSVILVLVNHCLPAVSSTRDAQGRLQPQGFRKISQPFFGGPISEGFAFLKHRGSFSPTILFPSCKCPSCPSPAEHASQHPLPNVPLTPESSCWLFPPPWTCLGSGFVTLSEARPTSPNPRAGARLQKTQDNLCRFAEKQR